MDKRQLIQVLSQFGDADAIAEVIHASLPLKEPLPSRRRTERTRVLVNGHAIYVEVGFYDDGEPGEVFLQTSKFGTEMRDIFSGLATVLSVALQHGVPISAFQLKGKGNDLTGDGNELLNAVFTAVEELCNPNTTSEQSPTSTSSTEPLSVPAPLPKS